MDHFTQVELKDALRAISSTVSKCEKVLPKLKQGTAQHTLLTRRIRAFEIASSLISKELAECAADSIQDRARVSARAE